MQNVEGDIQKLESNCFRVLMMEACEEDTLSDIRDRIAKILQTKSPTLSDEVLG